MLFGYCGLGLRILNALKSHTGVNELHISQNMNPFTHNMNVK